MSDIKKSRSVEEQQRLQRELIELKRQKQQFESNPEEYKNKGGTAEIVLTKKQKLSNFWYYGRNTVIALVIIAVLIAVCVVQCTGRTEYDCTVVLYMKRTALPEMIENVATVMEKYCPDYNGDGEVNVLVVDCAIPDEERMLENGLAGSTRLMGQFASEKAIIYIADKEALLELDQIGGGVFVDNSLSLPEFDGKALKLNGTVFDAAFNVVSEKYTNQFDYYILRRAVIGTAIEGKGDVNEYSNQADEIIGNIVADPELKLGSAKP